MRQFESDEIKDYEFNQCFICRAESFEIDQEEVCEAKWVDLTTLRKQIEDKAEDEEEISDRSMLLTPWLQTELREFVKVVDQWIIEWQKSDDDDDDGVQDRH
jgi:isopentenyldiphosphate isomerase